LKESSQEIPMPDQPRRPRTLNDARSEAEAAFKKATAKVTEAPPKQSALPSVKELVSLRIDQDVLEYFQQGGPGWQERINAALRKAAGK
jgi:uncharacterized protein (DUF4415 family)